MAWKAEEEWGGPRLGMASISISFSAFHLCSHFPQPLKRAVVNGCQVDVLWGLGRVQRWQFCHISLAASFQARAALHSKNQASSLFPSAMGIKVKCLKERGLKKTCWRLVCNMDKNTIYTYSSYNWLPSGRKRISVWSGFPKPVYMASSF